MKITTTMKILAAALALAWAAARITGPPLTGTEAAAELAGLLIAAAAAWHVLPAITGGNWRPRT